MDSIKYAQIHLPQIVADLKYRRKIAEKVFSANLRVLNQRILREKNAIIRPDLQEILHENSRT